MFWRAIRELDLPELRAISPAGMGTEILGPRRTLEIWRDLIHSPAFFGALVESEIPVCGCRIIGYGAGVFVATGFLEGELADPRPGLAARLIASIGSDHPAILNYEDIKSANSTDGLDVMFFDASWRRQILSPEQDAEAQALIAFGMFRGLEGNRFRLFVREAHDSFAIEHTRSHRVLRVVSDFRAFFDASPASTWNHDRALFVCSKQEAWAVPASLPAILYSGRDPVLGLRGHDQELLRAALKGLTDQEQADELGLRLPAVKKRWAAIFQRIATAKSDLLPGIEEDIHRQSRGRQKRHYLLDYLRAHPEELRPYLQRPRKAIIRSATRQERSRRSSTRHPDQQGTPPLKAAASVNPHPRT